jgi:hypothetical protein
LAVVQLDVVLWFKQLSRLADWLSMNNPNSPVVARRRLGPRLAALAAGSLLAGLVSAAPAHAAASTYGVSLFSGTPNTFASSFSTSAYGDPESDAVDPVTGDLYVVNRNRKGLQF